MLGQLCRRAVRQGDVEGAAVIRLVGSNPGDGRADQGAVDGADPSGIGQHVIGRNGLALPGLVVVTATELTVVLVGVVAGAFTLRTGETLRPSGYLPGGGPFAFVLLSVLFTGGC
jgi:hypothetical protein